MKTDRGDLAARVEQGLLERAIAVSAETLRRDPADSDALDHLIEAAAQGGSFEHAYAALKRLLAERGYAAPLAVGIGRLFVRCGLSEVAIASMRKTIAARPKDPLAYSILAGAYAALGRQGDADLFATLGLRLAGAEAWCAAGNVDSPLSFGRLAQGFASARDTGIVQNALKRATSSGEFLDWRAQYEIAAYSDAAGDHERARLFRNMAACVRAATESGMGDEPIARLSPGAASEAGSEDIFFVAPVISPRVAKLALALRRSGRKVILFTRADGGILAQRPDLFDRVVTVATFIELWAAMADGNPYTVHAFVNLDGGHAEGFAALAQWPDRLVFDPYDLADASVSPLTRLPQESEMAAQFRLFHRFHRLLINHATGICTRSLYPRLLHSADPARRARQHRRYLPDLSWGTAPQHRKLSADDGMLHIVHGSTFWAEQTRSSEWRCIFWLGERAKELGIHLHLYPVPAGEQDMGPYERLAQESDHFHLHNPLPYDGWLTAIQAYDVGLFYIHPRDAAAEGEMPRLANSTGAWGNKFGDYLDAELYMVLSWRAKVMSFAARRYGVGEAVTPEDLYTRKFWDRIKERVLGGRVDFTAARRSLSIAEKGPALVSLYDAIERERTSPNPIPA